MKKIAVIINNKAKNVHQVNAYLDKFNEASIQYALYQVEPDALAATIQQCINVYPILLVGGGDGSIRTAAHYCANSETILGVLALGTLNHFAKELDLPMSAAEMVASLVACRTDHIDLAQVNDCIFVNNSAIGFYPKFAKKRDHYTKKYNKWLSYLPGFIDSFQQHETFSLVIKGERLDLPLVTSFVMISNNLYSYKFPVTIKREDFKEGLLGLYYFKYGKIRMFELIRSLFSKKSAFEMKQFKQPIEIHFKRHKEVMVSLDGDTVKLNTPLYYQSLPQSLKLILKSSCV